jgi:dCMP deaminase
MSKRVPTSAQDVTGTEKAAKLTEINCIGDSSLSNDTEKEDSTPQTPSNTTKRKDYLSWDEYFMAVAFLSAQRSKDPSSQVGACVVNREKKIVGIGYNGMPNGCSDDELPWARHASNELETKYPYGKLDYQLS